MAKAMNSIAKESLVIGQKSKILIGSPAAAKLGVRIFSSVFVFCNSALSNFFKSAASAFGKFDSDWLFDDILNSHWSITERSTARYNLADI